MKNSIENSESAQTNANHGINFGKLGVVALKTMQATARFCLPTVTAAAPANEPKKPPPMKYQDLPLYDCPHFKYQSFQEIKAGCPDQNVKIFHEMVHPTVKEYRKSISETYQGIKNEIVSTYNEISGDFRDAERKFLTFMRDPENMSLSICFMGVAAVIGFKLGNTRPRRFLASGLALFLSGTICFPDETDATARAFMYHIGKACVPIYNFYFETDWELRERVPCERDLPQIPPPTKPYPGCEKKGK